MNYWQWSHVRSLTPPPCLSPLHWRPPPERHDAQTHSVSSKQMRSTLRTSATAYRRSAPACRAGRSQHERRRRVHQDAGGGGAAPCVGEQAGRAPRAARRGVGGPPAQAADGPLLLVRLRDVWVPHVAAEPVPVPGPVRAPPAPRFPVPSTRPRARRRVQKSAIKCSTSAGICSLSSHRAPRCAATCGTVDRQKALLRVRDSVSMCP